MRRVAAVLALIGALVGVFAAQARTAGGTFEVHALFDTAKGMVGGQAVKIAGVVAGKVEEVEIVDGPKARFTLSVERRFAPFHADASCRILPEGLISENYVECDPGSRGELPDATVPVEQTAVPTSLQEVINVFSLPVSQRIRVFVHELGLTTAGRGEDINALIRRTNPALEKTRQVLSIIGSERDRLASAVAQTDRVVGTLAARSGDVRAFVDRAAAVTRRTADRRAELGEAVRDLAPMLRSVRGGLRSVDTAIAATTPLLADVRDAAPQFTRFTQSLPAFSRAALGALGSLERLSGTARPAIRAARPVVKSLRRAARTAVPFGEDMERLLTSTRDTGGLEGALQLLYGLGTSTSAFDDVSHFIGVAVNIFPHCLADRTYPACSHKYDAPGHGRIPVNDPDCGERRGAPWDPATDCQPSAAPVNSPGVGGKRRKRPKPKARATPTPAASHPAPRKKPRPKLPLLDLDLPELPLVGPQVDEALDNVNQTLEDVQPLLDYLLEK